MYRWRVFEIKRRSRSELYAMPSKYACALNIFLKNPKKFWNSGSGPLKSGPEVNSLETSSSDDSCCHDTPVRRNMK